MRWSLTIAYARYAGWRCEARVSPKIHFAGSLSRSRQVGGLFDPKTKCRMSILRVVIRHCSRCAAKTELCVTVVFFELWFLSIPESSRRVQELSIDWLLDLAVDLHFRKFEMRISKFETLKSYSLERR